MSTFCMRIGVRILCVLRIGVRILCVLRICACILRVQIKAIQLTQIIHVHVCIHKSAI